MRRHEIVAQKIDAGTPGTIVIEQAAAPLIATGRINFGDALRHRDVRYYGQPLSGYGEERGVFSRLPAIVKEMI